MTFTENLTWFFFIFFVVFAIVDIIIKFSRYYRPIESDKINSNHKDKNKMFFDDETREALK